MRSFLTALLLPLSLSAQTVPSSSEPAQLTAVDWPSRARTAADQLESALDGKAELRGAVTAAVETLGTARTADRLRELLRSEPADDALASAVEIVVADLRFRPTLEADLPASFPEPAPVDEIVLKRYPSYRMARTRMQPRDGSSASFWRLFQHIKANDIAMTAPVQVDYAQDDESARQTESMAFLYGDPRLGDVGEAGQVDVVDVEPTLAISIGGRGYETRERVAAMREELANWLAAHADEFEAAGPMRTMGYNSPMMPAGRRFFEVEIPVRPREVPTVSSAKCADTNPESH